VRAYLETSVIIVYCFGEELEPARYKPVKSLFDKINSNGIEGVVSFYSLNELFMFAIENFPSNISRIVVKKVIKKLFETEIEIIPLLNREQRIQYSAGIKLNDASDVPHAILSLIEKCDCIVTYDSHFNKIDNIIKIRKPDDLL